MTAVTSQSLQVFRSLLTAKMGLEFPEERLQLLCEVLTARAALRQESVESYLVTLGEGTAPAEFPALAARLTVPESYFFRNADQFRALRESVLPEICAERSPLAPLRVLSAGCASGEEPYSLAITLKEWLNGERSISVVAVDVNPEALARARAARYSEWALRETPPGLRAKWFQKNGREFELQTRELGFVEFIERNLAGPTQDLLPKEHYDLIFCRNFLMYLTRERYLDVATRLGAALVPGGFMFLGHAETLRGADRGFEAQQSHGTFYYRKDPRPGTRTAARAPHAAQPRFEQASEPLPEPDSESHVPWFDAIAQASARITALSDRLNEAAARSTQLSNHSAAIAESEQLAPVSAAIAVTETTPDAALEPVLILLQRERYAEALELVESASSGLGQQAILLLRALLLTHADRGTDAEQSCRELLELDTEHAGAHYVLALCRDSAGDPQGALSLYERAAALDATFAMPRLQLGFLQRRLANSGAARRNLALATTLLAQEADARVLLFGGGFSREVLVTMSASALRACEQGAA